MGHCTDRLKDKRKEKNLHPRWKTNREKNRQTRKTKFETKDAQKSVLFLFHSLPSVLESHNVSKLETHS